MASAYLIFCNSRLPLSPIIRAVTWGRWSHVAVSFDLRGVYEATGQHGVTLTPLESLISRSTEYCVVRVEVPEDSLKVLISAAAGQLGKPYDWWGIFGLALKRDWQDPTNWWCSEYAAYIFAKADLPLLRSSAIHRATPEDLWKLPLEVVYSSSK